jgi:hypothetical protein
MNIKEFARIRVYVTVVVTIAVWSLVIWDYFHGGVPSHHILQRADLPKFSNWWGGILVPLLTFFLLYKIQKRITPGSTDFKFSNNILYAFVGALSFGIGLSLFFISGNTEMPFYMIIALLFIALILPIYRAEYFLGFVLGMTVTFGGVLPLIIISILSLIGVLLFLVVRPGILFIISKIAFLVAAKNRDKGNV